MATNKKKLKIFIIVAICAILVIILAVSAVRFAVTNGRYISKGGTDIYAMIKEADTSGNYQLSKIDKTKTINDHSLIAENDNFRLYLNEDDLSIVVENKANGSFMESAISYDDGKSNKTWYAAMKSALLLTLINKSSDTKQADLILDTVTKKITKTKDGFSATVYWTKYKLGMTLNVILTKDGVVACVPDESIKEDGKDYQIGTICIYPYMGTSYMDTKEGYIFIPDGNGALIYLDDKEGKYQSGYSAMVYGKDIGFDESSVSTLLWDKYEIVNKSENVIAPVYGIAHTDDKLAYLAIVEKGAMRANIEAWPNGASVDYNRAFAKFIERKLYTQPTSNNSTSGSFKLSEADRSHSDLQIRFIFLTDENANYAGMANAYRNYLLDNGTLSLLDAAYNTRIDFLGTERKNFVIGTQAVTMTTVADIKAIYKDLKEAGVEDVFSVYKGWQKGGLLNYPITEYKADSNIGSTGDLTKFIKDCEEKGIEFYLYNDALLINPSENNATFNIVKKINKRKYVEDTYKDVYKEMMYLTPQRSDVVLANLLRGLEKKNVNNLCVDGISNTLFSWNYNNSANTRFDCAAGYYSTLSALKDRSSLVLVQPSSYLWSTTKAFLDMPLYTSNYIYEEESVPFLSIVLKGVMPVYSEYVNFEANKQEFFLKLVETGTYPSFYITKESSSELIYTNSSDVYSSEYDVYKDEILSYTKELKKINDMVSGATIKAHDIDANKVTTVTYSNGVKIIINYSDKAQQVGGSTIEAMSYKVVTK